MDVPFSVQTFSDAELERRQIRDLDELITFVPGASETIGVAVGQRVYQIRQTGGTRGDSTVGYYLDDYAFSIANGNYAPIGRPFDLDRVEVLKGPQGTLYGSGSMGGTIRYITAQPDLEGFGAHGRGGYSLGRGADDSHYLDAAINVPLVPRMLGLRLAGDYERIGGYQEDAVGSVNVGDTDVFTGRAILSFRPLEELGLSAIYNRNITEQDGGLLQTSLDPPITTSLPGGFRNLDIELVGISGEYAFDFASISSATAWIDLRGDDLSNFPFPGAPNDNLESAANLRSKSWNNETRIQSTTDGPIGWIAGVFLSETDETFDTRFNLAAFPSATTLYQSDSWAVFGEVSVDLLDGRLTPLVGLRYFEDERSVMDPVNPAANVADEFSSLSPRFNLSYQPDERSHYYANVAKGFRSGSFNIPSICNGIHAAAGFPCEVSIDSDTIWSYEIGTKQRLGPISFELAGYYEDWTNIRQDVPVSGLFQTYQFGDAEIFGLDLELIYRPTGIPGLGFTIAGNFNRARFKNVDPALGALIGVSDGDQRPFTPQFTLAAMADYGWSMGDRWSGTANLNFRHISSQLGRFGTGASGDRRDLLGASIGLRRDNIGIRLFAKNLLGEDGAIFSQTPSRGITAFTQDYPRQFGIELSFDFQ